MRNTQSSVLNSGRRNASQRLNFNQAIITIKQIIYNNDIDNSFNNYIINNNIKL